MPSHNGEFPAEVRIETADGEMLKCRNDVPPGGSTRPLSDADVTAKFRDCASAVLTPAAIDAVIHKVQRLDQLGEIASLCELLEGEPSSP